MEQKNLLQKRLGIAALILLAFAVFNNLTDLYESVKYIASYTGSSYVSNPYQDEILINNHFIEYFSAVVRKILPIAKYAMLGIILVRISRTGVSFSRENKKDLQWYGILSVAQAFFVLIAGPVIFQRIINFLFSCLAAIIWFCWPDRVEDNSQNSAQSMTLAGILHIAFIIMQAMYAIEIVWYLYNGVLNFLSTYWSILLLLVAGNVISILFYNQIGRVFLSISKDDSKFDAANVKRIKAAARIYFIGAGIMTAFSLFDNIIQISRIQLYDQFHVVSAIINNVASLAMPFVILFLALAYERGAGEKLEANSTETQ